MDRQSPVAGSLARRAFLRAAGFVALTGLLPRAARSAGAEPPRFLLEWGRKGTAPGEFHSPIGLAINAADELYVTDWRNSRVQKFTPGGRLLAVIPTAEQPGGIAVDGAGQVYVAHFKSQQVVVYTDRGEVVRAWGGYGTGDGQLSWPGGIALGPDGGVYVADQTNRRVQKFTPEGKFLLKWGEYGVGSGQFGGNVQPGDRTGGPQFLAFDRQGHLYTTEGSVGRIQKFTADGKYLAHWGDNGTGPGGFGGRRANLPGPIALCFDRDDHLWVSATSNRVQQFTKEGRFLRGFGAEGTGPGQFHVPHGMVVDTRGCLYVVDSGNARVQKFQV